MSYKNLQLIWNNKVILWEVMITFLLTFLVFINGKNYNYTLSVFLGGILVIIPTFIYSFTVFINGLVAYPSVALKRHQKAMVFRFLANFVLFALVMVLYRQCNFVLLFLGYIITLSGYWLSLIKA